MPRNKKYNGWPDGVNNVFREDNVPSTSLRQAKNADILHRGKTRRRKGFAKILNGVGTHSVFTFNRRLVFVKNGSLSSYDPKLNSEVVLKSGLHKERFVSYSVINQRLFWSDGYSKGIVEPDFSVSNWGVETPTGTPSLSLVEDAGGLDPGIYQVAITYLDASGEESGALLATAIEAEHGDGIQVTGLPQPTQVGVSKIRLYISGANGTTLYYVRDYNVGTVNAVIGKGNRGKALDTQFYDPLPAGDYLAYYKGCLFSAFGDTLRYSLPMRFGLTQLTERYYRYATNVDLLVAVEGGLYIAAGDQTYFLSSSNNTPTGFQQVEVYPYGAVPRTGTVVHGSIFGVEGIPKDRDVAVWWGKNGVMLVGGSDGRILPVREGELSLPEYTKGAVAAVESDGVRQILSVLRGPQTGSSLAATDSVSVEVKKNGITL